MMCFEISSISHRVRNSAAITPGMPVPTVRIYPSAYQHTSTATVAHTARCLRVRVFLSRPRHCGILADWIVVDIYLSLPLFSLSLSIVLSALVLPKGPDGIVRPLKDRLRTLCKQRRIRLQEFFKPFDAHNNKKVKLHNICFGVDTLLSLGNYLLRQSYIACREYSR